ncbi:MAG TPA: LuxR C-terminal-related transcriptional regulator, partial [Roseiflexaceae bacterium]|nr:LuxR C-terminal-related transcriptional regulator [Roseiflexaceae bacterium]
AALATLERALMLAAPEGLIRRFVEEGPAMARLLATAAAHGVMPEYVRMLLAAFNTDEAVASSRQDRRDAGPTSPAQPLIEPLTAREVEILQLIAQGLSNHEMSEQLFLAVSTIKGHNLKIFGKLQVQRRTEAVARARELGLL